MEYTSHTNARYGSFDVRITSKGGHRILITRNSLFCEVMLVGSNPSQEMKVDLIRCAYQVPTSMELRIESRLLDVLSDPYNHPV